MCYVVKNPKILNSLEKCTLSLKKMPTFAESFKN
jgi:hypothetical protein